jgi:hypothetical protein
MIIGSDGTAGIENWGLRNHVQIQQSEETQEGGMSRRLDVVLSLYTIHFEDCKMMKLTRLLQHYYNRNGCWCLLVRYSSSSGAVPATEST